MAGLYTGATGLWGGFTGLLFGSTSLSTPPGLLADATASFSPASLFANGEPGVWYDPSDFSTMFTDAAGTTPVTAVEQPVGLIRDKSGRGNHASQSTDASRPVLSARVNLLTHSEQFDNATAWTKLSGSITATNIADPLGGTAAEAFTSSGVNGLLGSNTVTVSANTGHTSTVWLKVPSGTLTVDFSIANSGYGGIVSSSCALTTQWQQFTVSGSVGANTSVRAVIGGNNTIGTGVVVHVWGADLRVTNVGSNMPVYQRVGAATYGTSTVAGNPDYDTTGFPFFLAFNGVTGSRSMVSSTITPGTDKAQVFAGVRKLSDAVAIFAELSATTGTNAGSFYVLTGGDPDPADRYSSMARGNAAYSSGQVAYTRSGTAPDTAVITATHDIPGDVSAIRRNGTIGTNGTADKGTGNFGNYPLYIGARGGSSLYYDGNLYELIVRFGPNLSEATIDQTEVWVGDKTGLNLSYATQQTIFDRFNATVLDRAGATILQRY